MLAEPPALAIIVGIAALITILGSLFGWFGQLHSWLFSFLPFAMGSNLNPTTTITPIADTQESTFWWHMGSSDDKPAMQIVGNLKITNISKCKILITGIKLKKPKIFGYAFVRNIDSKHFGNYMVPQNGTADLGFYFCITPPIKENGKIFRADVAILDQFGNEHWVKNILFRYNKPDK